MHDTDAQDPGIVDGLRHSQERLQFFIDHAPGAMAMLDREMRYIAVNRDWQVHHAPDGRSVLGRCHYDVYPDMKAEWRAAHQRGLAGQPTKVEQERVALPDGSAIWLRWEVQPWYEAPGTVGGVVLFVEDITARVQSEKAAQIARQNLADLIGTIDGIVWEADAATFRFTFVSAQAERLLGYPVSAWIDDPGFWAAHIHPVDREASVRYCVECTAEGRDHQFDYRMLAADGRVVWLQDRVTVHVVDGRPMTLRGVMVDITERKRAEAALRESEERFRTLADSAPMLVWTSGPDRRCDFFNRRRLEFTGRALNPDARDGWAEGLHPDERLVVLARHEAAFEAQAPFEMDYRLQRADGEFRWMSAHAVPRFDAQRRVRRLHRHLRRHHGAAAGRRDAAAARGAAAAVAEDGGDGHARRRHRPRFQQPAGRDRRQPRARRDGPREVPSGPGEPGRDAARRASRHRAGQAHPHLQPSGDARAGACPARARGASKPSTCSAR